jgi:hypothetical protein
VIYARLALFPYFLEMISLAAAILWKVIPLLSEKSMELLM